MRYIFLFTIIIFASCQRTMPGEESGMGRHHEVMATILWTGSLETDGCDWVIKIGNDFYHPDSLSQVFRRDQLEVFVSYETPTGIFVCGLVEQGYPIITITSIRNL